MSFWTVPASAPRRHSLLLGRHDVHRHYRQHRAVHGHRHRHPLERDPVEQDLHVLDRVDGHPRLAHVAGDPRMVRVVAAVGGEVEGDGQPGLTRFEVAAVERVRLLGRRVARVLAQGPGTAGVHRRPGAPDVRREARQGIEMLQPFEVRCGVERLHVDAFRSPPRQIGGRTAPGLLLDERRPCFQPRLHVTGHGLSPDRNTPRMRDRPARRELLMGVRDVSGRKHPCRATPSHLSVGTRVSSPPHLRGEGHVRCSPVRQVSWSAPPPRGEAELSRPRKAPRIRSLVHARTNSTRTFTGAWLADGRSAPPAMHRVPHPRTRPRAAPRQSRRGSRDRRSSPASSTLPRRRSSASSHAGSCPSGSSGGAARRSRS